MIDTKLYSEHLAVLNRQLTYSLERSAKKGRALDGVLFHAGRLTEYHADDQMIVLHETPHFRRWVPLTGPEHLVLARPGKPLVVVRVTPRDFWYDTSPPARSYWEDAVDLRETETFEQALKEAGSLDRIGWIGSSREAAEQAGIPVDRYEPAELMAPMDWHRAYKTSYEVEHLRIAARKAGAGHRAGLEVFRAGESEREIHWAYLKGAAHLEWEVPYETIVALDAKGAILHYQHKRGKEAAPGKVLLIDAGAASAGYASDITRTWTGDNADPVFVEMVRRMDACEQELTTMVTPGRDYREIHIRSQEKVASILADTGVFKCAAEEAMAKGLNRAFYPHGVGHHLGLQVHDIGGRQSDPDGGETPPPAEYPALRTTRALEPGHVVTIEPGLYFIEMLLEPVRNGADAALVDWKLVDRLGGPGGVPIADHNVCTDREPPNLTRSHAPSLS